MGNLDPIELSRELERIDEVRIRWEARTRQDPSSSDEPLQRFRDILGMQRIKEVLELPEYDPLREPLFRWLFLFTELRVNQPWHVEIQRRRYGELHGVEGPERVHASLAEFLERALRRPTERRAWLDHLAQHAGELRRVNAVLWHRRVELTKRLQLSPLDSIECPGDSLESAAERWLDCTRDLAAEWAAPSFANWLGAALGTDADKGWPARLSERAVMEWFRSSPLLKDLELRPGTLPPVYGASSFVRALVQLGTAFREAAAPEDQPFVIAHDPMKLEAYEHGYLWGGLLENPEFALRQLQLSRTELRDHLRVLARVRLLDSRCLALRVKLRGPATESRQDMERAFLEGTEQVFGAPLPVELCFVLPRLHADDVQRFAGLFAAEQRTALLVEAHDQDWFRNPRGCDQLRSEAHLPPQSRLNKTNTEAFQDRLLRRWTQALG